MVSVEYLHLGGIMSINVSVTYMNYMPKTVFSIIVPGMQ